MLTRYVERTLVHIGRRPARHAATALCLAVAFLAFGAFAIGWWTLSDGLARWGGEYEATVYVGENAAREPLRAMLAAQPEVASVTHVDGRTAKARLARTLPETSGLSGVPSSAFPESFELRLHAGARTPRAAEALAARLRGAPGVESVETYGPWLSRLASLVDLTRAAALAVGLLVLGVTFVVVGFATRLSRAERRAETDLLRLVGATSSYIEVPLALEGALQGLVGAALATLLLGVGVLAVRAGGAALVTPPVFAWIGFAAAGALVGAVAARRTAGAS